MSKKRIVVVCPGRGSYTKETLGYLQNRPSISGELHNIDLARTNLNYPTLSEMDSMEQFKVSLHTKGEHASPLIYLSSKADFKEINSNNYDIVAVTGNSMGWYLTLAFAGALNEQDSFELIQTMGAMMKNGLIGGQIIYPIVNDDWQIDLQIKNSIEQQIEEINQIKGAQASVSIYLGGYVVLAGNKKGLELLKKALPTKEHYPFQLVNHGAFHTPLLQEVSNKALQQLSHLNFKSPNVPMIDGRGQIWQPYSTDIKELFHYTLDHQVIETYDFTRAITVALKEFAPDHIVLLGPGNSLGGAIGQILIAENWLNLHNKADFSKMQKEKQLLISMGLADQKRTLTD